MHIPFVDLHAQYLSLKDAIDQAIATVIAESAFIRGRFVEQFEHDFAAALGIPRCISCANGTDALYIALKGLGVRPGDEVITTAHSWISTSETITQAGGQVVFCDTDAATFTINPAEIAARITPRTVGIVPVHLYGQPADMDPIMALAARHNLWVLEDCAQAHLAEYKGRKVGTIGNAGTFSFYPGKNLGAMGDAGCIVTRDDRLAEWCTLFARHGGKGNHLIEGINSRMDGLQAAILSVKLPYLKQWTRRRQEIAKMYHDVLNGNNTLILPQIAANRTHVFHLYVIRSTQRDRLRQFLAQKNIATGINYPTALPFCPAYKYLNHLPEDFPNAHLNQKQVLSLPIYPEMQIEQLHGICTSIFQCINA